MPWLVILTDQSTSPLSTCALLKSSYSQWTLKQEKTVDVATTTVARSERRSDSQSTPLARPKTRSCSTSRNLAFDRSTITWTALSDILYWKKSSPQPRQRTLSAPSQRLENSISRFDRRPTCPAATTGCYGPPLCIRPIAHQLHQTAAAEPTQCVVYSVCGLSNVLYSVCGLSNVLYSVCGLSNVLYSVCGLSNVLYSVCGLSNVLYSVCGLSNVLYSVCGLSNVLYSVCGLSNVLYSVCGLSNVLYSVCGLSNVLYSVCGLSNVLYSVCSLSNVLYSVCGLSNVLYSVCGLSNVLWKSPFKLSIFSRRSIPNWFCFHNNGHFANHASSYHHSR